MKVAIMTDSNSGITQSEAKELGIFVLPMPFTIDGQEYKEDINLTQEEFYDKLMNGAEVFTSQPAAGEVTAFFDRILEDYDQIVHIPMSVSYTHLDVYKRQDALNENKHLHLFLIQLNVLNT